MKQRKGIVRFLLWIVTDKFACLNQTYCKGDPFSFLPPANEVWGKVIFLHLFVILSAPGVVVCSQGGLLGGLLPGGSAPGGCLVETPQRLLLRAVCILLECILVVRCQRIFLICPCNIDISDFGVEKFTRLFASTELVVRGSVFHKRLNSLFVSDS